MKYELNKYQKIKQNNASIGNLYYNFEDSSFEIKGIRQRALSCKNSFENKGDASTKLDQIKSIFSKFIMVNEEISNKKLNSILEEKCTTKIEKIIRTPNSVENMTVGLGMLKMLFGLKNKQNLRHSWSILSSD